MVSERESVSLEVGEKRGGGRNGDVTWEVLNTASGILKDFNKQISTSMTESGWEVGKSSHPTEEGYPDNSLSPLQALNWKQEEGLHLCSLSARAGKHKAQLA